MNQKLYDHFRELRNSKNGQLDDLILAANKNGEARDMSADESAKFEALAADVARLTERIDAMEAEDEAEDQAPSRGIRSGDRRTPSIRDVPAIHGDERSGYSYFRAILRAAEGRLDGLEAEVSQEIARRSGKAPMGFYMPIGGNPEIRRMMFPGGERRDLTTTTGSGAIFTEPEGELIDVLRGKLTIRELGATILTGMRGNFAIPRQTGAANFQWLGEGVSATTTNQTFDQVPFTPRIGLAATGLTRMFLAQTALDAEKLVKDDLAAVVARALDSAAINGPGGVAPLGILNRTGIQARSAGLALGANGGTIGWNNVVAMESLITTANADQGALAYLTTPAMRGKLKSVAKVVTGATATGSITLWENGDGPGKGEVNGYPAFTSTLVPASLSKGTGTGLSAAIFGYWRDLVVALWEGADCLVNPFSPQLSAGVIISMNMNMDVNVKHDESFCFIADAITS